MIKTGQNQTIAQMEAEVKALPSPFKKTVELNERQPRDAKALERVQTQL